MNNFDFLLIIFSALLHAGWNFFTKKTIVNKVTILWFGWGLAGLCTFPFALMYTDFSSYDHSWILFVILTGLAHAGYIYTLGLSYSIGEMSLIYPISRGIAIILTLSTMLLFSIDTISPRGSFGVIMILVGIILVALKRFGDLEKRAVMLISIKVGIFVSLYSIIDKISLNHIPVFFYISAMFLLTSLLLAPFILHSLNHHIIIVIKRHKTYSGLIGVVSFIAYYFILVAMSQSPASYVVALREISIVFGSVLGMWLLREERNRRKIAGILIIVVGAYIIKTA